MAKGILGKKLGMTQIFEADGRLIPVTVVEAGPCVVLQNKTEETDGYHAVQLGFGEIKEKHTTKPMKGHFDKAFSRGPMKHGSKSHREPGSMGPMHSGPGGRVIKGKKLPGRMGNANVTVQRLTVVKVDAERNLILVKGAIPGATGSYVVLKETVKPNK